MNNNNLNELKNKQIDFKIWDENRKKDILLKIPEINKIQHEITTQMSLNSKNIFEGNIVELDKIKVQIQKKQNYIKELLSKNGYKENDLDDKFFCEKCKDKRYINKQKCNCFLDIIIKNKQKELSKNMPNIDNINLDNFIYENLKNKMWDYIKSFDKISAKSLLFAGGTGTGKTFLSLAIAKELIKKGFNVIYGSSLDLIDNIKSDEWNKIDNSTFDNIINCDVLVLDDLGVENHNQHSISTIYKIINTRINKQKISIISTNLTSSEISKIYHDRVLSRLLSFRVLKFFGEDMRIKKQ